MNRSSELEPLIYSFKHEDPCLVLFNRWRHFELLGALFSSIGLILGIVDYEYNYPTFRIISECSSDPKSQVFRFLIIISTVISIAFFVLKDIEKSRWKSHFYAGKKFGIFNKESLITLMCLLVFPYPFITQTLIVPFKNGSEKLEICYELSEMLLALMFFRVLIVMRSIFNYTKHRDYLARRFCQMNKVNTGFIFSFKWVMLSKPMHIILLVVGIPAFFVVGFCLMIFERPASDLSGNNFENFYNSVSFMLIALATLGYGDFAPITLLGRMSIIFSSLLWAFLLSIVVVSLEKNVDFSFGELRVCNSIEKAPNAALCIQRSYHWYRAKKERLATEDILEEELMESIKNFKEKKESIGEQLKSSDREIYEIRMTLLFLVKNIKTLSKKIDDIKDSFSPTFKRSNSIR